WPCSPGCGDRLGGRGSRCRSGTRRQSPDADRTDDRRPGRRRGRGNALLRSQERDVGAAVAGFPGGLVEGLVVAGRAGGDGEQEEAFEAVDAVFLEALPVEAPEG